MTDSERNRRTILKAGGTALMAGLAGCLGAIRDEQGVPGTVDPKTPSEDDGGNGGSEVDQYLSDANGYDGSIQDMTGQSSVTVEVGAGSDGLAFGPAAIQVDPGTTVTWEWTGNGGGHNVVDEGGAFESEIFNESGQTFEFTFDNSGVFTYFCSPHKTLGMKGAVVVGDGSGGGGGGGGAQAEVDEYLSDANGYDGIEDMTGQDSVTVEVGAGSDGLAFGPAAIEVDPGTTVTWEWTGNGGGHNVVDEGGAFESELSSEEGNTFEFTFDNSGVFTYFCSPHKTLGMKGAVVVSGSGGGGGGGGGGGQAEVDEYLSDANGYDGIEDMTGQGSVTVEVGAGDNGLAFGPAAIRVDSGTTVTWEWTGNGGGHNVIDEGGAFESELSSESGNTFEFTFENSGVFTYFCSPHKTLGMKGAVVVE